MAGTDIQPGLQLQIHSSSGNPQARILFSAHWGEQEGAQGHPGPKGDTVHSKIPPDVHNDRDHLKETFFIQMNHFWCKLAGAQSTAQPQMPRCDLGTWLLEKADAGRWGQVLRISGDMNSCTKMGEILISLAKLWEPITKSMTSDNTLEKSIISLHGSYLITSHPAKQVCWQDRQNFTGKGSSYPHQVPIPKVGCALHTPS